MYPYQKLLLYLQAFYSRIDVENGTYVLQICTFYLCMYSICMNVHITDVCQR